MLASSVMIDAMHVKRSAILPIIPAWPDVDGEVHGVVVDLFEEGCAAAAADEDDDDAARPSSPCDACSLSTFW